MADEANETRRTPWEWRFGDADAEYQDVVSDQPWGRVVIARVFNWRGSMLATAQLVRAAPAMLQALRAVRSYLRTADLPGAGYNPMFQQVIKAIARAEGRE